MANPSAAHEPSMEEILASIRQIISEDSEVASAARHEAKTVTAAQPQPAASRKPEAPAGDAPSIPVVRVGPAKAKAPEIYSSAEADQDEASTEEPPATDAKAKPTAPRAIAQAIPEHNLLSTTSDEAVSGAFSALAHTILAQNARTLEDLVTEMLKPMLKGWLDDNLPNLVERLVKEEIERVSRGRR